MKTLGQIAFETFRAGLPACYVNQHCIPESWDDLSFTERIQWQRSAVAVARFRIFHLFIGRAVS